MATDSTFQLRRKDPADISNAESADQWRIFLNDLTGLLSAKDVNGNVFTIGGAQSTAFIHNAIVTPAASPYAAAIRETVKVNPTAGPITINLPSAIGVAGLQVKVINFTLAVNPVTVAGTLGQTINGAATYVMNTPAERLTVESDGTNWIVV